MFIIKSYISNYLPHLGYLTSKKEEFLSINDPLAKQAARLILKDNEEDYLEGCITATYNSEVIFTQDFETTDLLLTWQTIIAPLLINEMDDNIAKEDYLKGITKEFLSFASFCFNNELKFCEESSYPSFILDYQTLKSKIDLN